MDGEEAEAGEDCQDAAIACEDDAEGQGQGEEGQVTLAADDHAYIARRLAEIRAERERHFGVILHPLPAVEPPAVAEAEADLGDYGFY